MALEEFIELVENNNHTITQNQSKDRNGLVFAFVMAHLFVDSFSNMSFLRLVMNGIFHSVWIAGLYIAVNFIFSRSAFYTIFELYREKKNQ